MPVKRKRRNEDTLMFALNELENFALDFEAQHSLGEHIEDVELARATTKAKKLFQKFEKIAKEAKPTAEGLEEYLDKVILITSELHNIATKESGRFASPNEFMYMVTTSFETFANKIASKQVQEAFGKAASFIPVIGGVVSTCGGIPYYFQYANRDEKVAMILSAVLLLTALAITIAMFASPAIAGVPFLAPAIASCVTLSMSLYDHAVANAKKSYKNKEIIYGAKDELQATSEKMNEFARNKFPKKMVLEFVNESQALNKKKSNKIVFTEAPEKNRELQKKHSKENSKLISNKFSRKS